MEMDFLKYVENPQNVSEDTRIFAGSLINLRIRLGVWHHIPENGTVKIGINTGFLHDSLHIKSA